MYWTHCVVVCCLGRCQYEALKYTIFPVVVVFKSSKMIPVMLIGSLKFFGKKYPATDYIVAVIIACGVTLALVGTKSITGGGTSETTANGGGSGGSGGSGSGGDLTGLLLMFGYIFADSFTSNWQSYIFKTYKSSSLHMMFAANSFSSLILAFTVSLTFFFVLSFGCFPFSLFANYFLFLTCSSFIVFFFFNHNNWRRR